MAPRNTRESEPYPLYGTTFHVFRVSPLYNGNAPILDSLAIHARRFRDIVKGDTLRGFQIAAEIENSTSAPSSSTGAFKNCTWDLLGDEEAWTRAHAVDDEDEDDISMIAPIGIPEARGVHVQILYERITYSAILLGQARDKSSEPGFTRLPLLLVKMPAPLREAFTTYLTTTFDTHITPMHLRASLISRALEAVLSRTATRAATNPQTAVPKAIQIQLAFPTAAPNLRGLDIGIAQDDILPFRAVGTAPTSTSDTRTPITGPFTAALAAYLQEHLALDLVSPAIQLAKVAFGGYALASEGKVRIAEASGDARTVWALILGDAAPARLAKQRERKAESARAGAGAGVGVRVGRLPTDPPPPYELHDPHRRESA
ncbi:hypothetical protein BT63DRAFT_320981 [Microthyrium microscopicum]|uniref:Kinetochore complex Sim4 subunit Fta1-domain-containing protein n=1 Tax=Microthyrium microscopicum TaxID=703497 RepID=A0A6A6U3J7_9PEZI|nr:hypothetical protein BT63DRAFT_320981 [Microthyrium microscopicum]